MKKVHTRLVYIVRYEFESEAEMNQWCAENMSKYTWERVYGTILDVYYHEKDITLVSDTSIVAVDSEDARKKINFLNHLTNVSRAHGFHLQQNDNLYIRRNGAQEFGEWIIGWDEEQEAYLLTNCDY